MLNYIRIFIAGFVISSYFIGYMYYHQTQKKLEENSQEIQALESANLQCTATLERKEREEREKNERINSLTRSLQRAEASRNVLISTLHKHDLTKLSLEKPGLIEKRINDATEKTFTDIKSITID